MLSRAGTAAAAHPTPAVSFCSPGANSTEKPGQSETMNQLHAFVSQISGSSAKSRTSSDFSHPRRPSDEDALRSGRYANRPESQSSQYSDRLPAPLLSHSRTPSPLAARQRSAHQSEDEDEPGVFADSDAIQQRPLVPKRRQSSTRTKLWQKGGLGRWLFQTAKGRDTYVALLVFWLGGCQFGTLLINRFILWTGTYRLPYPLTMTLLQLIITHILLLGFANLTRLARTPLINLGFEGLVAPSEPLATGPQGFRRAQTPVTLWSNIASLCGVSRGGITGSGVVDFNWRTIKQVLPLAIVFFVKVVLSNISYASAVLPVYQSARIGVIPFSLVLAYFLERTSHTTSTLSSVLTAVLNLLMASIQPNFRAPWTSIAAGVLSSFFVALYPVQLLRTYRSILETMGSGRVEVMLESSDSESENEASGSLIPMASVGSSPPTTRAYYTLLHYTSLLSILLLIPCTLLSGEVTHMLRHCYFLDVPWFWFLIFCSSLGGFTVFASTLLMVLATSSLSTSFVMVPRSVFQLVVLSKFKLPVHSWVGVSLCWASCISYVVTRRQEAKGRLPRAMTM